MVLESTIICCDNSDYQRNGDYIPTRLSAQTEAINLVSLSKIRSHPENNVALITIADKVEVLATLTSDVGKISMKMGKVAPKGEINLLTGLRIAHLVLKHRQGKNHRMRIVAFVGSPLKNVVAEDLQGLAKRLKKEKVQVDIISFGGHEGNDEMLRSFVNTLNGNDGDGSHLLEVPRGAELADSLIQSPILMGEDGSGTAGLSSAYAYGIDPNEDPDLALALRISMEEERQRQAAERQQTQTNNAAPAPTTAPSGEHAPTDDEMVNFANMTEEDQIAYALAMSLQQEESQQPKTSAGAAEAEQTPNDDPESNSTSTHCCTSSSRKNKDKKKKK